jgi:hypothetical protein
MIKNTNVDIQLHEFTQLQRLLVPTRILDVVTRDVAALKFVAWNFILYFNDTVTLVHSEQHLRDYRLLIQHTLLLPVISLSPDYHFRTSVFSRPLPRIIKVNLVRPSFLPYACIAARNRYSEYRPVSIVSNDIGYILNLTLYYLI